MVEEQRPARPKTIYLAHMKPGFSPEAFTARWRQHGKLAMGLPIWRNMIKYMQCDPLPLSGNPPAYDAIGVVWYRSWDALNSIGKEPSLREPLLEDELKTFSKYVREGALLTEETLLRDGVPTQQKLFLFLLPEHAAHAAALADISDAVRIVRSDVAVNEYTRTSALPYRQVFEYWVPSMAALESCAAAIRAQLAGADGHLLIASKELLLDGPVDLP